MPGIRNNKSIEQLKADAKACQTEAKKYTITNRDKSGRFNKKFEVSIVSLNADPGNKVTSDAGDTEVEKTNYTKQINAIEGNSDKKGVLIDENWFEPEDFDEKMTE